jgi:DNA-directed RNA polymerase specialized sigma24 family protein
MTTTRATHSQPSLTHPAGSAPLVRKLVTEWGAIAAQPQTLRVINQWGLPGGPIEHLDEVLLRAGYGIDTKYENCDAFLFALVKRAAHDDLAARIVLQRILPPLIAIAGRRGHIVNGGFNAAFNEILGQAWILIRQYPVDRRPAKIASNLVRDTEYFAFVRNARLKRLEVESWTDDVDEKFVSLDEETIEPSVEFAQIIHDAVRRGIRSAPLQLIMRLSSGETIEDIAAEAGVCVRTVRTWRRKAIIELRERTQCAA